MKALIIIGLLAIGHPSFLVAEADLSASTETEAPPQQRTISKLPTGVTHTKTGDTLHEYRISGIYPPSAQNDDPGELVSVCKVLVPGCLKFDLDFKQFTATFSTSKELSLSELADAVDNLAKDGGNIPYWAELEARDLPPSKRYPNLRYSVRTTDDSPPSDLAWFLIPKDREFRIPLSIGDPEHLCTLLIVPSTAYCMCHSSFDLRILDPEGKVIWRDEKAAFAAVRIALSGVDEYGKHKIWLNRNDHGKQTNFVIIANLQEESK